MATSNHDSSIQLYALDSKENSTPKIPQLDLAARGPLPQTLASSQPVPTRKFAPSRGRSARHDPNDLDGNVLFCPCPECGAPMTIRIWLSTADCWRCDISIALSFEQLRAAVNLARAEDAPAQKTDRGFPRPRPPAKSAAAPDPPRQPPPPLEIHSSLRRRTNRIAPRARRITQYRAPRRPRPWWQDLRAWVVSAIAHLILLALLALMVLEASRHDPFIVLSTEISRYHREGGPQDILDTLNEVEFDLPVPAESQPNNQQQREALLRADQEARELRIDPDAADVQLPRLENVKSMIVASTSRRAMLAARDPRVRVEMIRQEGGTTLTEAAVARGLRWMSHHQSKDGSWSLERFDRCQDCQGRCSGKGKIRSDTAGTSLVLLPFLGAGQTHLVGRYQDTVALGLRWLIDHQKANGDLRAVSQGNSGMYAHGQATIVLCEAYAMTGDEQLREFAQKATDFIVDAQHEAGGWRYEPRQPGDTSVLGWQLMALQSARAAQLDIPDYSFENASHFLDSVQSDDGAQYAYMRGQAATPTMTSEALLCRMYLGWDLQHPGLRQGVDQLIRNHLPERGQPNFYYWYYATQVMHHAGGSPWKQWNHNMRNALVSTQIKKGHEAGSWTPREHHDQAGGRVYATALATCTLEVYYRHVPIFRRIRLD